MLHLRKKIYYKENDLKKILLIISLVTLSMFAGGIKLIHQDTQDMVYQLPLKKFQKFICEAKLDDGRVVQFVSVKSMLQVYFHQKYFLDHKLIKKGIQSMYVQDFLTGDMVNAKDAVYMFGSNQAGPHGDDLIPFKNIDMAKIFKIKSGGTRILTFKQLDVGLVRYLDM
jgi:hypothetical protein